MANPNNEAVILSACRTAIGTYQGGLSTFTAPQLGAIAIREARQLKIPVIAYTNTDSDSEVVEYLVLGNTKSRKSIQWFLVKMEQAFTEGAKLRNIVAEQVQAAEGEKAKASLEITEDKKEVAPE